jgi:hypothetical protein
MEHVRRIFASVDRAYLIRGWAIGGALFVLLTMVTKVQNAQLTALYAVNTALFPFAKLVWDEIRGVALGQTVLLLPAVLLYVCKLFINAVLWGLSIFIAPMGIFWVWCRDR